MFSIITLSQYAWDTAFSSFYPWRQVNRHSRTPSCSSDTAERKFQVIDACNDPGSSSYVCVVPQTQTPSWDQASPELYAQSPGSMLQAQHEQNNLMVRFGNRRPVSAYGAIFGNAEAKTINFPPQHLSISATNQSFGKLDCTITITFMFNHLF